MRYILISKSLTDLVDSRFGGDKVADFRDAAAHRYPKLAGGDFSE